MRRDNGCSLTFAGEKCLSVTTHVQRSGQAEFFISALGGPDTERHLHGFAALTSDGVMLRAGARLKNDRDEHMGPGVLLVPGTTQELGRVTIQPTSAGPLCTLKQSIDGQWLETAGSTMGGPIRRKDVPLPSAPGARGGEYAISFYDAKSGPPPTASHDVVIPFSSAVPFGMVVTTLSCY